MGEIKFYKKSNINSRVLFIIGLFVIMFFAINQIYSRELGFISEGKVDLSNINIEQDKIVALDGEWEFYWGRLLTAHDFGAKKPPKMDSLIKVPGSWSDKEAGTKVYPDKGVATYRLNFKYPSSINDPALSIKTISAAYKLYANGQLIVEVGKVSDKFSESKEDYKQLMVDLPNDTQEVELIFQVANLHYIRGGLRDSLIFGSKQVLVQQKSLRINTQLIFIGVILGFGFYYLILFILNHKNKTGLIFSIICFMTSIRALLWGETPWKKFFPNMPVQKAIIINYMTEYNLVPVMILFIVSLYPLDYKKKTLSFILMPTLFFEVLLLTSSGFMAKFNLYFYILQIVQTIYMMSILIKAVINRRDNAVILLMAMDIFIFSIIADKLHYKGLSNINFSYMFLYGNFIVILSMSYIQAKKQADTYQKLILYNENLKEVDKLKDKIMETEMSFLQAQIKPHFLYNALSAIANVCEKDSKMAGKLIIDLALYLRRSLNFNHLDKMETIEKELEFIDTYINIEKARFGEKIQLHKKIEVSLNCQIPILIIQPLVENAVRHGISKKIGGGAVYLRISQDKIGVFIEIEDEGVGINDEKLAIILSDDRKCSGIGLLNINNRLIRLYGKGLEINSEIGLGTCVKLFIPKRVLRQTGER